MPLPFATALHIDSRRNHSGERVHLRNDRVEAVSIPAFAYGIEPAAPAQDCETIGLRLLLVANKNVSSDALLDALRSMSDAVAVHTQVNLDATNANPEFPVHPGAEAFLRARRPSNLDEILGPTTDALSVVGASIAGCLALWSFVRGLRAVQPDVHLRQIDRIERLLQGSELDESAPTLPREFLEYLESRLSQIKQAAIEDYANGPTRRRRGAGGDSHPRCRHATFARPAAEAAGRSEPRGDSGSAAESCGSVASDAWPPFADVGAGAASWQRRQNR